MSRRIDVDIEVPATVSEIWKAWTTTEGVKSFFAPAAKVHLSIGGEYEIYFDRSAPEGERGSEGCCVLAFKHERLLLLTWNAPPQFPAVRDGNDKSWVVIEMTAISAETTYVSLTHLGWKDGDEWDSVYDYFTVAWPKVLTWLRDRFIEGPRKFD